MARTRKPWESLTPAYRQRLQRGGLTKTQYESGTGSLAAARGHTSTAAENSRRKFLRSRGKYITMTAEMLGRDEDEQEEHFLLYSESDQMAIMETQEIAFDLYKQGDKMGATRAFQEVQNQIGYLPYWLLPYHGRKF